MAITDILTRFITAVLAVAFVGFIGFIGSYVAKGGYQVKSGNIDFTYTKTFLYAPLLSVILVLLTLFLNKGKITALHWCFCAAINFIILFLIS